MKNENTLMIILVAIIVLFLFSGFGMMAYGMMGFGNFGMMSGSYGGMGMFGWLFMVLVAIALILLIIWLIKKIQEK